MKKRRLKSISTVALALVLFSPAIQSLVNPSYKVNASPKEATNNSSQQSIGNFNSKGLMGYYFEDAEFKNPIMIGPERSGLLNVKKGDIHSAQISKIGSAKFLGNIKPKVSGDYTFKTSATKNIEIKVNNKVVVQDKKITSIKLEKDKLSSIEITYTPEENKGVLLDLQLSYSTNNKDFSEVPSEILLLPDLSGKIKSLNSSTDTDGDSIPNDWELNGYTVDDNLNIIQWNDSLPSTYKKYTSNSNKSHTVADPYTDAEKVLGKMPAATSIEARDPMVAAYPAVGVGMEKLHFSKNENVTEGTAETKTVSTTTTTTNSNTAEFGAEIGGGKDGFSLSFSPKYSHTWTSSTADTEGSSESWSQSISMNTADAAYLNANVRYHNAGNAPIYNATPTVSFNLRNSNKTLLTILSKADNIANGISPNETYPQRNQPPMALTQLTNNGTRMSVDKPTLDKIQNNTETIDLITNQTSGDYGVIGTNGQNQVGGQWGPILGDIESSSAGIILSKPGLDKESGSLERRVAVKNYNDNTDKTPEITVGDAIKKAFNTTDGSNGMFYYDDPVTDKNIYLHESAVSIILDTNTSNEIKKQLDAGANSIYECKLKRGMNITINVPKVYYDFENGNNGTWQNIEVLTTGGGFTGNKYGRIGKNKVGKTLNQLNLKPYTNYKLRAMVWTKDLNASNEIGIKQENGNVITSKHFKAPNASWQPIEFEFNTDSHPELFKSIFLKNSSSTYNLHFDEIQVLEFNETEQPIQEIQSDFGNANSLDWTVDRETQGGDYYGIDKVVIPVKFTENKYDYKVVQNGTNLGTRSMPSPYKENDILKVAVNLDSYNGGKGINVLNGDIQIISVDKNTKAETLIGTWEKDKKSFNHDKWNVVNNVVNGEWINFPSKSPEIYKYKVVVDGKQKGPIKFCQLDYSNGAVYVHFPDFNGGNGLNKNSHIQVYAVDTTSAVPNSVLWDVSGGAPTIQTVSDEYLIGEWGE